MSLVVFSILGISILLILCWKYIKPASSSDSRTAQVSINKAPISEKQRSIFIKNWTVAEFRKEFGKEYKIQEYTNYSNYLTYKYCIFRKGVLCLQETWVRFATTLEDLSLEDFRKRENELMIGQSDTKKYVLYDNNIKNWNAQDVDLGI